MLLSMMILIKKKGSLWPFMISAMMMVSSSSFADNSSKEIKAKSVFFVDFGSFEKSFPDLAKLIKKEEFEGLTKVKRTIASKSFEMNLSVTLADVVKYMFLKGLLSIPEDNLLWNLGGEIVYVDNGEKTVKFKKLSMDNHDNKEKPEIIITPQIDSESTVKVQFSAVLKINIDVDNNVPLQKLILEDFYGCKIPIFSIFDGNFADNFTTLAKVFVASMEVVRQNRHRFFFEKNFYEYYHYICLREPIEGLGKLFKDAYGWEKAAEHKYEKQTILLFNIDFNEVVKIYNLCTGNFFTQIGKIIEKNFSVDSFNLFPELLEDKNLNHAMKLIEKIAKKNNVNFKNLVEKERERFNNVNNNIFLDKLNNPLYKDSNELQNEVFDDFTDEEYLHFLPEDENAYNRTYFQNIENSINNNDNNENCIINNINYSEYNEDNINYSGDNFLYGSEGLYVNNTNNNEKFNNENNEINENVINNIDNKEKKEGNISNVVSRERTVEKGNKKGWCCGLC